LQLQDPNAEARKCLSRADIDAAPIPENERALMRFVEIVTKHAYKTTDEDVQRLRDLGWTDPQIAEAVYIAALFAFFNRVADAFGLDDPNYFRQPPEWWAKPEGDTSV
jgi:alkylhydroperoxidase family enzyme